MNCCFSALNQVCEALHQAASVTCREPESEYGTVLLTGQLFSAWCSRNQISKETAAYIQRIRASPPHSSVRGQRHGLTDAQLTALLRCSRNNLTRLRLCRLPATEQELAHLAYRFHVDQAALSALLSDSSEDVNAH